MEQAGSNSYASSDASGGSSAAAAAEADLEGAAAEAGGLTPIDFNASLIPGTFCISERNSSTVSEMPSPPHKIEQRFRREHNQCITSNKRRPFLPGFISPSLS